MAAVGELQTAGIGRRCNPVVAGGVEQGDVQRDILTGQAVECCGDERVPRTDRNRDGE